VSGRAAPLRASRLTKSNAHECRWQTGGTEGERILAEGVVCIYHPNSNSDYVVSENIGKVPQRSYFWEIRVLSRHRLHLQPVEPVGAQAVHVNQNQPVVSGDQAQKKTSQKTRRARAEETQRYLAAAADRGLQHVGLGYLADLVLPETKVAKRLERAAQKDSNRNEVKPVSEVVDHAQATQKTLGSQARGVEEARSPPRRGIGQVQ